MDTVQQPGQGIDTFDVGGIERIAEAVDAERHRAGFSVVSQCPAECVVNFLSLANVCERFGDGTEVTHPKEIEVAEARAVEDTFPEPIDDLCTDLPRVAIKLLYLPEVAVYKLALFGTECAESSTDDEIKMMHLIFMASLGT